MTEPEFQELLKDKTKQATEIISEVFSEYVNGRKDQPYVGTMLEAMEYSFMAGGKRLRPLLMRETYHVFAGNGKESEALGSFMTALEMIHTSSLVHDDLPALDNDEYRRGKETTWKVYGDAMAVLSGDALLNSAFEIAISAIYKNVLKMEDWQEAKRIAKSGAILAGKAGIDGMLGGQGTDVETEKKHLSVDLEEICFIHEKKTAALIEAAMCVGAVLAGASEDDQEKILQIARKVGIAFQIQDDLLDVFGDSAELGKMVGSDAQNGKETYVTLKGAQASAADVKRLSEEAVELLRTIPGEHTFLEELILYLIYRKK